MKIIHLTSTAKKTAQGGAGWITTIAKEYIKGYPEAEIQIWQIVPDLTSIETVISGEGIKYIFFPGEIGVLNYANSSHLIKWFSPEKHKDDIFHIHGQLRGVACEFAYRFAKTNHIIFSFWGPININQPEWNDYRVNDIKCVTYCNRHNIEKFSKIYRGKLINLTVGVNTDFFMPKNKNICRANLNIEENRFVIVMVARFIAWKQIKEFIESIKKIQTDYLFLLVGDGPLDKEIRETSKEMINKGKIQLLGALPRESNEILEVLNSSDLFATVSKGEGASGAVMEALACELPIFSTNFGGTVDFLKAVKAGIIVDVDDTSEWEEKLRKIIDCRLVVTPAPREKVIETYSWISIRSKINCLYHENYN